MKNVTHIVGIDEVGRGPLAGPVTVCACLLPANFYKKLLKGVRDSKKLSPKQREGWFEKIKEWRKIGLVYAVTSVDNKIIDSKGIVFAINKALLSSLKKTKASKTSPILLDGGLKAPKEFLNQKTIIKGDEKEPVISLASIIAKVTRDDFMTRISKRYPQYGFHIHKGYGTKVHYDAIREYGISPLHRKSFLKNLL